MRVYYILYKYVFNNLLFSYLQITIWAENQAFTENTYKRPLYKYQRRINTVNQETTLTSE